MTLDTSNEPFGSYQQRAPKALSLQVKSPLGTPTPATPSSMSTAGSHLNLAEKSPQLIALVNVRVFDGYNIGDLTTVIIDGDKIGSTSNASGAELVDAEGGILIPGLIDCHCHVDDVDKFKALQDFGITTVLDMEEWPLSIVRDMKAVAGKNGYPDYFSAGLAATSNIPFPYPAGQIRSIARARPWVADRVHEGSGTSLFNILPA